MPPGSPPAERDDAEAEPAEADEHPRRAHPSGAEEVAPHPLLPAVCWASHALNALSGMTITCVRISP